MAPPDFETFYTEDEARILHDAHYAITVIGLWGWLSTYDPPKDRGFMFDDHTNLNLIMNTLTYQGHSGASFAWVMRTMESIAKSGGWENFRKTLRPHSVCPCRLQQGYTDGWCGVAGGGVPACEH